MKEAQTQVDEVEPQASEPVRQYADPIDEDALHDQIMLAIASEQAAFDQLPAQYDLSKGEGMPMDVVDPIVRK